MDGVIIFIIVFGSIMALLFIFIVSYFGCGNYCSYKTITDVEEPNKVNELETVVLEKIEK
jgi:hypothetical protein